MKIKQIIATIMLLTIVVASVEVNTNHANAEQLQETTPTEISLMLKVLGADKEKVDLSNQKTDTYGGIACDIKVEGKENLNGTYYMIRYQNNTYFRLAKALTAEEITAGKYKLDNTDTKLCKIIYEGEVSHIGKTMVGQSYLSPSIDSSKVKKYTAKMRGTKKIWYSFDGYINGSGNFVTSFVGDGDGYWQHGIFKNNKWKIKEYMLPASLRTAPHYYFSEGKDNTIWYNNNKRLTVINTKGKIIGNIKLGKWAKKHGGTYSEERKVIKLSGAKAIINFTTKKGVEKSYLVNMKNGKVLKKYKSIMSGEAYGKFLCQHFSENGYEWFRLVNWKTGKVVYKLNLDVLKKELPSKDIIYGYANTGYTQGFIDMTGILDEQPELRSVQSYMYKGKLYFANAAGVYRYDSKGKKLVKILDGKKQPLFYNMFGDFSIGKGDKVYLLGFYKGGDDEGATDFLTMTPKK